MTTFFNFITDLVSIRTKSSGLSSRRSPAALVARSQMEMQRERRSGIVIKTLADEHVTRRSSLTSPPAKRNFTKSA